MRNALETYGAPADLVIGIETPTLELTNELMNQCDRVLATGGGAMVNAAYSSGTPALGVGVGNAVITVDETADLEDASDKIKISKTLDLAASCSADNSVILVNTIYDEMISKFQEKGGYLVSEEEKEKLKNTLWDEEGHLNTAIVAQPADKIAEMADVRIPEGTEFYIVPETGWGPDHPFSGEKLSVVMALYKADNIDHAIELTNNIQSYQGQGHSCGIYSNSDENIMKLANVTKTSRVMVNQPQSASNSGNLWNGMRQTFSLGCGSWGGNGTNNNISWRDLINETWVSKPLTETKELRSDEELFGDVMDKIK
jgi:sulfoacetaldehyde dehydrogenase